MYFLYTYRLISPHWDRVVAYCKSQYLFSLLSFRTGEADSRYGANLKHWPHQCTARPQAIFHPTGKTISNICKEGARGCKRRIITSSISLENVWEVGCFSPRGYFCLLCIFMLDFNIQLSLNCTLTLFFYFTLCDYLCFLFFYPCGEIEYKSNEIEYKSIVFLSLWWDRV